MPGKRISMRKIREILRLKYELKRSNREVSISCGIGSSTVSDYLLRTRVAGVTWPIDSGLDDTALEQLLFVATTKAVKSLPKPALKPLPTAVYHLAKWKKATVNIDYHVEVEGHYYSVHYQLAKKKLDVRYTDRTVEILHKGKRVASHLRNYARGKHTTVKEHMPKQHQKYLEWTPDRILRWAGKIGPKTALLADDILRSKPHPQQAYRVILGILRLHKPYGNERLEAACNRALQIKARSYRSIASILKNNLDQKPLTTIPETPPVSHGNIRGADYYAQTEHKVIEVIGVRVKLNLSSIV